MLPGLILCARGMKKTLSKIEEVPLEPFKAIATLKNNKNNMGNVARVLSRDKVDKVNQRMVEAVGSLMGNEGIIVPDRGFENGVMKANKHIDLILQLPDEIETEVVRSFEA